MIPACPFLPFCTRCSVPDIIFLALTLRPRPAYTTGPMTQPVAYPINQHADYHRPPIHNDNAKYLYLQSILSNRANQSRSKHIPICTHHLLQFGPVSLVLDRTAHTHTYLHPFRLLNWLPQFCSRSFVRQGILCVIDAMHHNPDLHF